MDDSEQSYVKLSVTFSFLQLRWKSVNFEDTLHYRVFLFSVDKLCNGAPIDYNWLYVDEVHNTSMNLNIKFNPKPNKHPLIIFIHIFLRNGVGLDLGNIAPVSYTTALIHNRDRCGKNRKSNEKSLSSDNSFDIFPYLFS